MTYRLNPKHCVEGISLGASLRNSSARSSLRFRTDVFGRLIGFARIGQCITDELLRMK